MLPEPTYDGAGAGWITTPADPRLVVLWPGAEDYGDELAFPLYVALIQCAEFAPQLADNAPIPEHHIAAQVLQTRALVRAGVTGTNDQLGGYEQTVTVFPLDWTVKQLLRPHQGRPRFGTGGQGPAKTPGLTFTPDPDYPGLYLIGYANG